MFCVAAFVFFCLGYAFRFKQETKARERKKKRLCIVRPLVADQKPERA
jgi:hypothetical protein